MVNVLDVASINSVKDTNSIHRFYTTSAKIYTTY
jgi:hypothetical protein